MQGIFEITTVLLTALFSGLYIALSPCLFPLLPLYLMRSLNAADSTRKSVMVTLVLVAGILSSIAVFVIVVSVIQLSFIQYFAQIQAGLGVILVILGILTMFREKIGLTSMGISSQPTTPKGLLGVFSVGLGYSFLAAPCIWPLLTGTVLLFGTQSNIFVLIVMFAIVSIAVAIPYLAIAVVTGEARTRLTMSISMHSRKIELAAGLLLVVIGVILILPLFGITLLY